MWRGCSDVCDRARDFSFSVAHAEPGEPGTGDLPPRQVSWAGYPARKVPSPGGRAPACPRGGFRATGTAGTSQQIWRYARRGDGRRRPAICDVFVGTVSPGLPFCGIASVVGVASLGRTGLPQGAESWLSRGGPSRRRSRRQTTRTATGDKIGSRHNGFVVACPDSDILVETGPGARRLPRVPRRKSDGAHGVSPDRTATRVVP